MVVLAVVNERSACNVNVSFHLFDGTEVIPDSGVYRIDDTSGIEIKRVVELPEKCIQKEDFVRVMLENRQDHQLMFGKLDNVLEKLRE